MSSVNRWAGIHRLTDFAYNFWIINRFPSLTAYNIGYLLVIIAISQQPASVMDNALELAVFFFAFIFVKAHGSRGDALHRCGVGREDPQKSYVSRSVDGPGGRSSSTTFRGRGREGRQIRREAPRIPASWIAAAR
jgi:hypothetical protein